MYDKSISYKTYTILKVNVSPKCNHDGPQYAPKYYSNTGVQEVEFIKYISNLLARLSLSVYHPLWDKEVSVVKVNEQH